MTKDKQDQWRAEAFKDLIDRLGAMALLGNNSCPCGSLELFGIKINTHCWRSHNCCPYSGVHVTKQPDLEISLKELKEIGKLFAREIKESYQTEVSVSLEEMK